MLNVAIENTESPNISYVSFWPVSLLTGGVSNSGHWVNDQPDVYPTGLHVYSNQLVLNRGRPIGPSDCNNDHIQRFIKITNMVKKITPKEIGAYMWGVSIIRAILVFSFTKYQCPRNFIMINTLVNKKIMNFLLSLIKISLHNLFLMDFFFTEMVKYFKLLNF